MKNWHVLSKLTPQHSSDEWLIYEPSSGQRVKVPANILADYIIGSGEHAEALEHDFKKLSLIEPDTKVNIDIEEWLEQGWEQSLYYYSASRSIDYVDDDLNHDNRTAHIDEEVSSYMSNMDYPMPQRKKVDIPLSKKEKETRTLGWVLENRSCTDPMEALIDFTLDDLGSLLNDALGFMRSNYLLEDNVKFDRQKTMDTFGRPFRYYVINYGIKDLKRGVYLYDLIDHGLTIEKEGDYRDQVVDCLIGHKTSKNSSFSIVMVADLKIWQWFYRHERAMRNLYIDSGAVMQSLLLHATTYELRTHITPASHDSLFNELLGLKDIEEQVFYTLTAG